MEVEFTKKKKNKKQKKVKVKRVSHSKTSKKIIAFVIVSIFTFTGLAMFVQIRSGIELSPTLTTCFYAFCTGELWMLASIKKAKLGNGQKSDQYLIKPPELPIEKNDEMDDDEPKG